MSSIAMTGASGFLGRHAYERLVSEGHTVTRLGRQNAEITVDLLQAEPAWTGSDPTVLVHSAGIMAADAASAVSSARMAANVLASLPASVTKIVLVSSAYVYALSETPVGEDTPPKPSDIYSHTKMMVEELFRGFASVTQRALVVLRPCAIYGPNDPNRKVITRFVEDARRDVAPTLAGRIHQQRDYIHVNDAARAVMKAVAFEGSATFNVCTGKAWSAADVARLLGEIRPALRVPIEGEAEALGYRFDPTCAARDLDFRADVDLRTALEQLLA